MARGREPGGPRYGEPSRENMQKISRKLLYAELKLCIDLNALFQIAGTGMSRGEFDRHLDGLLDVMGPKDREEDSPGLEEIQLTPEAIRLEVTGIIEQPFALQLEPKEFYFRAYSRVAAVLIELLYKKLAAVQKTFTK